MLPRLQEGRPSTGRGVDKRQKINCVPKRVNFDAEPDDPSGRWHPDSLGQTVDNAIEMFNKSIVAPSVAIALTLCFLVGAPRLLWRANNRKL